MYVYIILCIFICVNGLNQNNLSSLKYTDKINRSIHCNMENKTITQKNT